MTIPRLPIRKFDENGLYHAVYINDFKEHLRTFHADIDHPHKHDFFMTVMFTAGKGKHTIDFTTYSIEPNTVFFLRPEQIHHWEFEEEASGWIVFHSEDFYSFYTPHTELEFWLFFSSNNSNFRLQLTPDQSSSIVSMFEQIAAEYHSVKAHTFLKIASYIQLLYIELDRMFAATYEVETSLKKPYQDHLKSFNKLLESHFKEQHSPKYYAENLSITTKHLHRICSVHFGKSPSKIIAERIVLEAKRMLVSETKTSQEIALILGFENPDYFHTVFKKISGQTTKQFIKSH